MKFYIGSGFKNVDKVNRLSSELQKFGWIHTYNWANIEGIGNETREDLINYSILELNGIDESDIVIIVLPAGRGTHIEFGYALAKGKKIILYSSNEEEFSLSNTVNFYELDSIEKVIGDEDTLVKRLVK